MNSEELFWSYYNYSLLIQFGMFSNIWLNQIGGF